MLHAVIFAPELNRKRSFRGLLAFGVKVYKHIVGILQIKLQKNDLFISKIRSFDHTAYTLVFVF